MATEDFLSVEVIGDRNLLRNLDQMPDIVRVILSQKVKTWTEKLADKVRENIESRLNRHTGKLLGSVKTKYTNRGKLQVEGQVYIAGVPYAEAQEEGATTPPHMIYPTKAKVLAFIASSGDKMFAMHVFHPGAQIPAEHFMKDAYREMGPEISRGIKTAVVQGIRAKMRQQA